MVLNLATTAKESTGSATNRVATRTQRRIRIPEPAADRSVEVGPHRGGIGVVSCPRRSAIRE